LSVFCVFRAPLPVIYLTKECNRQEFEELRVENEHPWRQKSAARPNLKTNGTVMPSTHLEAGSRCPKWQDDAAVAYPAANRRHYQQQLVQLGEHLEASTQTAVTSAKMLAWMRYCVL
jgi:hypothetical protein